MYIAYNVHNVHIWNIDFLMEDNIPDANPANNIMIEEEGIHHVNNPVSGPKPVIKK